LTAYRTLGLPDGAGEDEIKNAYRALAQKYNLDNYEADSPLREEAMAKMDEINAAFDTLMSILRTGAAPAPGPGPAQQGGGSATGRYPAIRQMINAGQIDEALAELSGITGAGDAEWNFLMGSAYYYKGWLDQAMGYFREAVRLEPGNREYEAALRNLQQSQDGNMQGNPYGGRNQDAQAMNCACNTCTLLCCLDACCRM